jgi:hypothetical protein
MDEFISKLLWKDPWKTEKRHNIHIVHLFYADGANNNSNQI